MGGWRIGRWNTEELLQQIVDDAIAALDLSKIEADDSSVEVVDTGAGGVVDITLNGNGCFRFAEYAPVGDIPIMIGTKDDNGFYFGAEYTPDTIGLVSYFYSDGTASNIGVIDPGSGETRADLIAEADGGSLVVYDDVPSGVGMVTGRLPDKLVIRALQDDDHIELTAVQSGFGTVTVADFDPSGGSALYWAGYPRLATTIDGVLLTGGGCFEVDPTPNTDETGSGDMIRVTVDANTIGIGGLLHLESDGNFGDADADAEATCSSMLVMAMESGTGVKKVLTRGFMRQDSWNWTVGAPLYADTDAGDITETAPSGSGEIVRVIGYAMSADIIFFDPDKTFIEVA